MEIIYDKIENGQVVNSIVADAAFIATQEGTWELREQTSTQEPTPEELSRLWRDGELTSTDYIVPVTDHTLHSAYTTYRSALRDWPSTSDFPDIRPTL
tara:strand:- start:91 stop:384 length:294 start_codon:yes stop_codon:yes gene_type:complete